MSDLPRIQNPLKVNARVSLARAELRGGGDLRFENARSPWKLEAKGNIEIEGQESRAVVISFGENKSAQDDRFGTFQPGHASESAHVGILLSPQQWQTVLQAYFARVPNLMLSAVISLDVPTSNDSESYGGAVQIFDLTLSCVPTDDL